MKNIFLDGLEEKEWTKQGIKKDAIKLKKIIMYTYLLTPWCRSLFEKLIVTQFVKKYPK